MMTTNDLLDAVRLVHNRTTDYQVAKLLQVSTSAMSKWRRHGGTLNNAQAFKVAELLGFPPAQVVAWMEAERAAGLKDEQLASWWQQRAAALAASLMLAIGLVAAPEPAAAGGLRGDSEYYVKRRRRKFPALEPLTDAIARLTSHPLR